MGFARTEGRDRAGSVTNRRGLDGGAGHEVVLRARYWPSHDLKDVRSRFPVAGDLVHAGCGYGRLEANLGGSPVEEGIGRVVTMTRFTKRDRSGVRALCTMGLVMDIKTYP